MPHVMLKTCKQMVEHSYYPGWREDLLEVQEVLDGEPITEGQPQHLPIIRNEDKK